MVDKGSESRAQNKKNLFFFMSRRILPSPIGNGSESRAQNKKNLFFFMSRRILPSPIGIIICFLWQTPLLSTKKYGRLKNKIFKQTRFTWTIELFDIVEILFVEKVP